MHLFCQQATILPSDCFDLPWGVVLPSGAAAVLPVRAVLIVVDRDAAAAGLRGGIFSPHICGHKSGVI